MKVGNVERGEEKIKEGKEYSTSGNDEGAVDGVLFRRRVVLLKT